MKSGWYTFHSEQSVPNTLNISSPGVQRLTKYYHKSFWSYLKKKDLGFSFHLQQTCRQRCSKRLEKSRFAAFGKICKHHQQMESSV